MRLSAQAVTLLIIEAICSLRWPAVARPLYAYRVDDAFERATHP